MAFVTSAVSHFDSLPNEIVREILNWAMVRDTPFDLGDCIRTATAVETTVNSDSQWPLYDASIESQQRHLQDWRIAGSVCGRVRSLGKEAFFTSKVFAMDLTLAKRLQARSLSRLSTEDQQIASQRITSVILMVDNLQTPSTFINIPRCIAAFPKLECLDFFFGGRKGEPLAWMIKAAENRMQPPSHFNDALSAIGTPTDKIAMGILISPDSEWSFHEELLKSNVYPMLSVWATMKLGKEPKKVEG